MCRKWSGALLLWKEEAGVGDRYAASVRSFLDTGGCLSDCLCMLNNEKRSWLMKTEAAWLHASLLGEVGWEGLLCEIIPQWAVKKFNASFNGRRLSRLGKCTTWSPAHNQTVKIISSSLPEDWVPSGWCWAVVPGCGGGGQRGALLQRSCAGGHHGGSGGQSQRHWPGCGSKHAHTHILWTVFVVNALVVACTNKVPFEEKAMTEFLLAFLSLNTEHITGFAPVWD